MASTSPPTAQPQRAESVNVSGAANSSPALNASRDRQSAKGSNPTGSASVLVRNAIGTLRRSKKPTLSEDDFVIGAPNPESFQQGLHLDADKAQEIISRDGMGAQADAGDMKSPRSGPAEIPPELQGLDVADLPASLRVRRESPHGSRIQQRTNLMSSGGKDYDVVPPRAAPAKKTKKSGKNGAFEISAPTGPAEHRVHVDTDFNWGGDDPTGAFRILDKVGEGGFGAVYKAEAKESHFVLAIKMVLTGKNEKEEDSLKKEIQILKRCHHPNVVSYYGSAKHNEHLWILMDFCGGGSIHDFMKKYQVTLSEAEIGGMVVGTLKGLAYLHSKTINVIHRDLKAANILITDGGQIKLADFGVSAHLGKALQRTKTFVGTCLWMAPQLLLQEAYDARIDIWSLGITIIECADGLPPLYDKPLVRAMILIPKNDPPVIAKEPTKFSPELHRLLARCLTKENDARPTAEELLLDSWVATNFKYANIFKDSLLRARGVAEGSAISSSSPSPITSSEGKLVNKKGNSDGSKDEISAPRGAAVTKLPNDPALDQLVGVKKIIDQLREELSASQEKVAALEAKVAKLEKEKKSLKKKITATEDDLDDAENDVDALEKQVVALGAVPVTKQKDKD